MLRTHSPVRALTTADRDQALEVCARDTRTNVFVAARILDGGLATSPGAVLGYAEGSGLQAICWASANLVPVGCDGPALAAFASRLRRWRHHCSSVFGPSEMVLPLWEALRPSWGEPRAVRARQPVLATAGPLPPGTPIDPQVRPARVDEVDLVMPAAAAMFAEEIGYPPYRGSGHLYRQGIASLIRQGRTFVRVNDGEVVFKADVGSVALGVAQVQGVWVAPRWRGQGLAVPAMAAVVEQVTTEIAPVVTLYVNDFNTPARTTYARVGFTEIGSFATVLM
ncbi:MAG TPA: GNAT family N-acetyltransferase [Dermatophilaceae bacterium]|nr:GNAT family N-acetyltransferase [Dermatophilaceae bacterium]